MSRGLGRWQRFILDGLAREARPNGAPLLVTDYAKGQLGRSLTPAEQRAITRAAILLEQRGLCRCLYQPAAATNRASLPRRLHVVREVWPDPIVPMELMMPIIERQMDVLLDQSYAAGFRAFREPPLSEGQDITSRRRISKRL